MSKSGKRVHRYAYTAHADQVMKEREVRREWVERVLENPEINDLDPLSLRRRRAFRRIGAFGDRWLRVVYEQDGETMTVVTAFFDRNAGRSR